MSQPFVFTAINEVLAAGGIDLPNGTIIAPGQLNLFANQGINFVVSLGGGGLSSYYDPGGNWTMFGTLQARFKSGDGSSGISTTITTASLVGKTITVKDGIIVDFS